MSATSHWSTPKVCFLLLRTKTKHFTKYNLGMFLYAKLVLENLLAFHTREQVIRSIRDEHFPPGLEQA
jgi:hypothetical protein